MSNELALPFSLDALRRELQIYNLLLNVSGADDNEISVSGVSDDSRTIQPGDAFFAVPGTRDDGTRYISDAIHKGAVAVIGESDVVDLSVPYLRVHDARHALARAAALLFGHPSRQMVLIGVTGTDGKTTTTNLIYQILLAAGFKTGMISTVNAVIGGEVLDTGFHVTTPEAREVQSYLARMQAAGITHVVLEATSHGLAQHRVTGCEFDVAVVTNITHEHLDFHGSYAGYRAAKARLFELTAESMPKDFGPRKLAVLNRDDESWEYLHDSLRIPFVSYGTSADAQIRAEQVRQTADGLTLHIAGAGAEQPVRCGLLGSYNTANILAAYSATVAGLGIAPETAARGIADLAGIPGRMEKIERGQNFIAVVDFAHTPNALMVALKSARELTGGRLIAVFGSAGLRDKLKRRMMAEISAELADLSIFTAEDPRIEPIMGILQEMADGALSRGKRLDRDFILEPDRRMAIRRAVNLAQPGDLVISCGKGHEQSMCFGTIEYLWDDRTAVQAALAELLGLAEPAMPFLPDPINYPQEQP